jgi:hypothetical protein
MWTDPCEEEAGMKKARALIRQGDHLEFDTVDDAFEAAKINDGVYNIRWTDADGESFSFTKLTTTANVKQPGKLGTVVWRKDPTYMIEH